MSKTIKATALSDIELKMLDIGAPVIVSCKTIEGNEVKVRIQTKNLGMDIDISDINQKHSNDSWQKHGAYIAIMPNGPDYGN